MINLKDKQSQRRKVIAFAVLFIFFALFIKLIIVQVIMYSKINYAVERMVRRETITEPKRGDILDSKGRVIATSVIKYTLFLDPKIISDFDLVKKKLLYYGIKIQQKNIEEFGETSYFPVAYNIDDETMRKIKDEKLFGVGFEAKYSRQYPEGRLLSNIIGITGSEGGGLEGIEKICEGYLSGEKVVTKQYRDGRGRLINDKLVDKAKIRGLNVELTIDKNIQFIAEQELRKAYEQFKPKKAICIIQNPKNGDILAMVSLPDFDFSDKSKSLNTLRNSAVSDVYEPGSTFKIVAIAAALEENKIKLSDKFYLENGRYKVATHTIRDDHKITGSANISTIMEESSNIGTVKIAEKLGKPLFYEYIRKFGFYSMTGIELPGESRGILDDYKRWHALSLPSISFGQSIGVTSIQLINSFSAIANNGVLMKPRIIKNIENFDFDDEFSFETKEVRRVVSEKTAQDIKKILQNVIDKGTGKSAKVAGYTAGGKTGTAQKIDSATKRYSRVNYIASFCGMVPALEPEFVILVVIDSPKGGDYYASSVAAPVFANIAKRTAEYLNIPKDDISKKK